MFQLHIPGSLQEPGTDGSDLSRCLHNEIFAAALPRSTNQTLSGEEPQNPRRIWVGRDLKSIQCHGQGHLALPQAALGPVQPGFGQIHVVPMLDQGLAQSPFRAPGILLEMIEP